jgi:hypothetical protein
MLVFYNCCSWILDSHWLLFDFAPRIPGFWSAEQFVSLTHSSFGTACAPPGWVSLLSPPRPAPISQMDGRVPSLCLDHSQSPKPPPGFLPGAVLLLCLPDGVSLPVITETVILLWHLDQELGLDFAFIYYLASYFVCVCVCVCVCACACVAVLGFELLHLLCKSFSTWVMPPALFALVTPALWLSHTGYIPPLCLPLQPAPIHLVLPLGTKPGYLHRPQCPVYLFGFNSWSELQVKEQSGLDKTVGLYPCCSQPTNCTFPAHWAHLVISKRAGLHHTSCHTMDGVSASCCRHSSLCLGDHGLPSILVRTKSRTSPSESCFKGLAKSTLRTR